jgi:hypothetical protein
MQILLIVEKNINFKKHFIIQGGPLQTIQPIVNIALEGCSRNAESGSEAQEFYSLCLKFIIGLMCLP